MGHLIRSNEKGIWGTQIVILPSKAPFGRDSRKHLCCFYDFLKFLFTQAEHKVITFKLGDVIFSVLNPRLCLRFDWNDTDRILKRKNEHSFPINFHRTSYDLILVVQIPTHIVKQRIGKASAGAFSHGVVLSCLFQGAVILFICFVYNQHLQDRVIGNLYTFR